MSITLEKFQLIFEALDYNNGTGLVTGNKIKINNHKDFVFKQTKKRLNIDGIYFVNDAPIIYFKHFSEVSEQQISNLHKKVWNEGIAPLLFVLLPTELRIYSAYKAPIYTNNTISAEEALITTSKSLDNPEKLKQELQNFFRIEIDAGSFWKLYPNHFSNDERINQCLLHNLKELRKELLTTNLKSEYIHSLIGRSLIILYLEDRGILTGDFYKKHGSDYQNFTNLLSSKPKTYDVFSSLMEFFGEDLFPVTPDEKKVVTNKHLSILQNILSAHNSNADWYFWAYSFDIIPIELICSIYEEFLYIEENPKEIASYTPPALAKIMLNQVLPYNGKDIFVKVLDPACGSSIFLLEAFKRIVEKWLIQNNIDNPDFDSLYKILKDCIFGFDYKKEALNFTMFSLYMAIIDFVNDIDLNKPPKLTSIIGKNLIESDFFNEKSKLHKNKYDIIIGNPPWQSNYGEKAKDYLKKTNCPVGDKQISQVFLWQAGNLITEDGLVCMLMPSKGLLYNFNPKNIEFRNQFFKTFSVKKIINLSLFSNLLFENSKFPASIITYTLAKNKSSKELTTYYTPKPSNKSWEFSTLVSDPSDIKKLPKQQILKDQAIWKIAYVGSGRDFILINHLDKNFPKIENVCESKFWKYGEGFQLGGGDKNINKEMAEMLYIPAKSIYPFYVNKAELEKLGTNVFHRPRDFNLYKAPHTLVRGGQIYAAYIDYNAVFTHAVMSFSSPNLDDTDILKLLAAYLNSSLVLYYLFLTSSTWCIERADIHLAEYKTLPFAFPSDDDLLRSILKAYDKLSEFVSEHTKDFQDQGKYYELKSTLDNYIYDLFKLDIDQRQLVIDVNKYTINYYQDYSKSSKFKDMPDSINKPELDLLRSYADTFCRALNKALLMHNYRVVSTIYVGDWALEVIAFTLLPLSQPSESITIIDDSKRLLELLKKLDNMVLKQTNESLYIKKNLRIFEGNTFYLVKPTEKRFWTKSMALNDSDKNIKEILKGFKTTP